MSNTITTSKIETVAADTAKIGEKGRDLVARLREIAAVEKAARDSKKEKEGIIAALIEMGGGAKYLTFHGAVIATRLDGHTPGLNREILKSTFPEAFAAAATDTEWTTYRGA